MRIVTSGYLTAASVALATLVSSPASADFSWNTSEGPLYFDDASGNYGVFYFLDANNNLKEDVAFYINELGPQYHTGVMPGTYAAYWYNYTDNDCGTKKLDPDGKAAYSWGTMWFTIAQDSDYFTAEVFDCDETTPSGKFSGTPGT